MGDEPLGTEDGPPVSDPPVKAVDPRQLELRSPREEFLEVVRARLRRLEETGEEEAARVLIKARDLGRDWLPARPGGSGA